MQPLVSVILPFYNAECTLNKAIASIASQSLTTFECILIDNNSTDKSNALANSWTQKDKRFKLVKESKQGVMYASNKGASLAKGKYLARMDADDVSMVNRLALQSKFLEEHDDYGAISGLVEYIPHAKSKGFAHYVDWVNSVLSSHEISIRRFIESPIVNPTALWRRELGEQLGLYRGGDFPEDYEMWLRWLHNGVKIYKLDQVVLEWYDSEQRLTRTNEIYSNDAFYRIKSEYLLKFLQKNNSYHPQIVVWGASKTSRKHAKYIEERGVEIQYYIDVNKKRQIEENVVYYEDLPVAGKCFVLIFMKHNTIREEIEDFLITRNYREGVDFLFVS